MDIHHHGNQKGLGLRPSLRGPPHSMEAAGNAGMAHSGLQHNHIQENDLGGGTKVIDQSAYFALAGHHGNMFRGNQQQQPANLKGFHGNLDANQFNQLMSTSGMHGSSAGIQHNMAMFKSQGMMGHGGVNAGNNMAMAQGFAGGMGQYGAMMPHGMQGTMAVMQGNHGHMMNSGSGMQHGIHMGNIGGLGGGQGGMANAQGQFAGQQYMDMGMVSVGTNMAHPHQHQHHQHPQQQHQQQQQQQHHQQQQFLGSPNSCMMSPPPMAQQPQQSQMHNSCNPGLNVYSASMKAYTTSGMESPMGPGTVPLQHRHHPSPHQHSHNQPQHQSQGHPASRAMPSVNLNQTAHGMAAPTADQLQDFRTLASGSAPGGPGVAASGLTAGTTQNYRGGNNPGVSPLLSPNPGMANAVGAPPSGSCMSPVVSHSVGMNTPSGSHNPQTMMPALQEALNRGTKSMMTASKMNMMHANQGTAAASLRGQSPHNLLQQFRTLQSSAVTLNVTSSSIVTQTASTMSAAVTTTHGSPVVSPSALQNRALANCLRSGPQVHNGEMNSTISAQLQQEQMQHQQETSTFTSMPSSVAMDTPVTMATSSVAMMKHLCSSTSAISRSGTGAPQSHANPNLTCLATSVVSAGTSLVSSTPAISALLSGTNRQISLEGVPHSGKFGANCSPSRSTTPSSAHNPQSTTAVHHHTHVTSANAPGGTNEKTYMSSVTPERHRVSPGGAFGKNKHGLCATSTTVVSVTVPFGWRRVVEAGALVYYSSNGIRLSSLAQVKQYLQTDGTCKCGLECPLLVEKVFNFNPQVIVPIYKVLQICCIIYAVTSVRHRSIVRLCYNCLICYICYIVS